jgi:hypothetical protein
MSAFLSSRDLFARYSLSFILAAIILTRIPFLFTGYGNDADAWYVANAASTWWHTGTYMESRLPGYPLHEILSAPFVVLGGAPLSNGATLLVTLLAVSVWHRIIQHRGRNGFLLLIAFAFAPVVWLNSAVTLDYIWSLLFLLLSLHAMLHERILLAGIALGLAAGFRPANIIAVVPLLTMMVLKKENAARVFGFIGMAGFIAACAFLPLIWKYGIPGWFAATRLEMRDVHPEPVMRLLLFVYRSVYFVGLPAAMVAGYAVWRYRAEWTKVFRSREALVTASLVGVGTFLMLYFSLPLDRAYLLPAFPFFLLLLDRCVPRGLLALFTVLLVLAGLLKIDVVSAGNRRAFALNVNRGMVLEELRLRTLMLSDRQRIASLAFPEKTIVVTGRGAPFWFENELVETAENTPLQNALAHTSGHFRLTQRRGDSGTLHVAFLLRHELNLVQKEGFRVVCLADAAEYVQHTVGYTLHDENIPLITP